MCFYFWQEELEMPEPEFDLYFWPWWYFGGRRVELGTVTHFSRALVYPKGKDLGIILLFQWVGYRVLLRRSQSQELRSMSGFSQAGWITGLGLLKYVLWYILIVPLFSWHYFRMLPTRGAFSTGGRGPFGHTRIRWKLHVFWHEACSSFLLITMRGISLHLWAVIPLITASFLPLWVYFIGRLARSICFSHSSDLPILLKKTFPKLTKQSIHFKHLCSATQESLSTNSNKLYSCLNKVVDFYRMG